MFQRILRQVTGGAGAGGRRGRNTGRGTRSGGRRAASGGMGAKIGSQVERYIRGRR